MEGCRVPWHGQGRSERPEAGPGLQVVLEGETDLRHCRVPPHEEDHHLRFEYGTLRGGGEADPGTAFVCGPPDEDFFSGLNFVSG
jgi:hypothetical protein